MKKKELFLAQIGTQLVQWDWRLKPRLWGLWPRNPRGRVVLT
jgi:hypothetical protein